MSPAVSAGGRAGRGRLRLRLLVAALASVGIVAGVLALTGSAPSAAAATGQVSPRTPFVQEHCPGTKIVYPPLSGAKAGDYYGVPIASTISGGELTIGSTIKTTGLTATVCGLLDFPKLTASIPATVCKDASPTTEAKGCLAFGEATTSIDGLVDLPTTIVPVDHDGAAAMVTVSRTAAADGGLQISLTTYVKTEVTIAKLGVTCTIGPIAVGLTTETSGPLHGAAVTGPLTLATAKVVGARFAVPAAAASTDCPAELVPATNALVGLPAAAGVARFTAPLTLANSLQ